MKKLLNLFVIKELKELPILRDESDRKGMRIVMEVRKDANANVVLNNFINLQRCKQVLVLICLHWLMDNRKY